MVVFYVLPMHTFLSEILSRMRQNLVLSLLQLIQPVPSTEICTFKGREPQADSNIKRS